MLTSLIVMERSLYADSLINGPLSVVVVNSRRPRSSCNVQNALAKLLESVVHSDYTGKQAPCTARSGSTQNTSRQEASFTCQTSAVLGVCTTALPGIGVW